jgi:hypothetical protein
MDPSAHSPAREWVPPLETKGGEGNTRLRGEPIRTTGEKAWHSVYTVACPIYNKIVFACRRQGAENIKTILALTVIYVISGLSTALLTFILLILVLALVYLYFKRKVKTRDY